jgi:hypothetical protein
MEIKLPDLRIVPVTRLVLHEESDPARVARIQERLKDEKILGNPPIVGQVRGSNRLIVLDGANRVSAIDAMGIGFIMVQVVPYDDPAVRLTRWHHLLLGYDTGDLASAIEKIPRARPAWVRQKQGEEALAHHRLACLVLQRNEKDALAVSAEDGSEVAVMRGVTDLYKRKTQIYRIADEQIDLLADRTNANVTAVVLFPGFRKSDIVRSALEQGEKLPPGITKHFIPNRALKVNLPLSVLRGNDDLKAKNRKLDELIAKKSREKKIRAYPEPTVIFDE